MALADRNDSASRAPDQEQSTDPAEKIDYEATPSFIALLEHLGCSLIVSSYQANVVMTFGSLGQGRPVQMFSAFPRAMGLALDGDRVAIGTKSEVVILRNIRRLASSLPRAPGLFDGYLVPRTRYTTGNLALHDMELDGRDVIAVNTNYSCICRIDGIHNFVPLWKPPFITDVKPGDRCHLNGMASDGHAIRYATALGVSDEPRGWHENRYSGGVLLEVPSGRIIADRLCMPHSPLMIGNRLFLLEAGTGELVEIDRITGDRRLVCSLPGFARGLAALGDYVFVGLSLPRGKHPFEGLPVVNMVDELICGLAAIHIGSGEIVGTLRYIGGCTEIHDIKIMPNTAVLGISGYDTDTATLAIDLPQAGFWLTPDSEVSAIGEPSAS